jgi:hypothetical protein
MNNNIHPVIFIYNTLHRLQRQALPANVHVKQCKCGKFFKSNRAGHYLCPECLELKREKHNEGTN